MTVPLLLCPVDPLSPRRADPRFAVEARLARELGWNVGLLDHDALLAGEGRRALPRLPAGEHLAWYRGWMVPAPRYQELSALLADRGVRLHTDGECYRRAHELPGWYGTFQDLTPASVWSEGTVPEGAGLAALARELGAGPGLVKDYVKSRKHEWDEACYLPDLTDPAQVARVVGRFVELQEEFLTGGVVLRAFEEFSAEVGEARVWWVAGEPVLVTAHPDTPALEPAPGLAPVRYAVKALGCPFVTTDLAWRRDGVWRVVEVGDGQVSDLPRDEDQNPSPEDLRPLFEALAQHTRSLAPAEERDEEPA
ncbi:ATP-grasp domain-containing protein [Streptomyces sp. NPDC005438]|uniref:ATP-grasp domain-containing protein n=1 Tax=Streptomyces sp. NPDC005438 TaxID=3156880 RepID=UPI0033A1504D